jgi:hypothetical protein
MKKRTLLHLVSYIVQIIGAIEIGASGVLAWLGFSGQIHGMVALAACFAALTLGCLLVCVGQIAEVVTVIEHESLKPLPRPISRSDEAWQRMVEQQNALAVEVPANSVLRPD